jgi:hypothetical protein
VVLNKSKPKFQNKKATYFGWERWQKKVRFRQNSNSVWVLAQGLALLFWLCGVGYLHIMYIIGLFSGGMLA